MAFTPEHLERRLNELVGEGQAPSRLLVAFSGGIDSAVLLDALAKTTFEVPFAAVHVDHGLHEDSSRWLARCEDFARARQIDFIAHRARVEDTGGGLEAAARAVRYGFFESLLQEGDWLMSAHHEDDQAETLLLNLLRGSGVLGLAGIALKRRCGKGWLVRPMLDVARADVDEYARRECISWIEDPSNLDLRFDRNFLRHDVLPRMRERWPALSGRLRRSAELAADATALLDDLAAIDLARAGQPHRLKLRELRLLTPSRQRNLLRYALRQLGLPAPPATRLQQVVDELIAARADAQPLVTWPGAELRRYREHVFVLREAAPVDTAGKTLSPSAVVGLGPGLGRLRLERSRTTGIAPRIAEGGLEICYRGGGERIRLNEGAHRQKLKTLLQDAAVVPWMRARIPLLKSGDRLIAVADLWTDAAYVAENGYVVRWDDRPAIH